jgi:uncharacterized membrane protein YkvA (DUF1232 family)
VFAAVAASDDRQRYKRGLFPSWIYDCKDPSKLARIRRHLPFHPLSDDARRYAGLKDQLALYRLVFGQPRQQDLLEHLQLRLQDGDGEAATEMRRGTAAYMINLSPFPESYARELAGREAASILRAGDASDRLACLLAEVADARRRFAASLDCVSTELDDLVAVVKTHLDGGKIGRRGLRRAVAALAYLVNPFDDEFDIHGAEGLADDIEVIRSAHRVGTQVLDLETTESDTLIEGEDDDANASG